jgi:hypothetical protein
MLEQHRHCIVNHGPDGARGISATDPPSLKQGSNTTDRFPDFSRFAREIDTSALPPKAAEWSARSEGPRWAMNGREHLQ